MALKNCIRTCVDDIARFVAFVELLAAVATLVFVGIIFQRDHLASGGDWRHLNQCWVVYSLSLYAALMILCGILGMFGSSTCKGLCLDLHALLTLLLLSAELVLLSIYFLDRGSLEKLGTKDPYGDFSHAIEWIEHNQGPFIACMATILSIQAVGFMLAWSVRLCCSSNAEATAIDQAVEDDYYGYEYAPIHQTPPSSYANARDQSNPFRFSEYNTPEAAAASSGGRSQNKYGAASAPGSNQFQQALLNGTSSTPPPKV